MHVLLPLLITYLIPTDLSELSSDVFHAKPSLGLPDEVRFLTTAIIEYMLLGHLGRLTLFSLSRVSLTRSQSPRGQGALFSVVLALVCSPGLAVLSQGVSLSFAGLMSVTLVDAEDAQVSPLA